MPPLCTTFITLPRYELRAIRRLPHVRQILQPASRHSRASCFSHPTPSQRTPRPTRTPECWKRIPGHVASFRISAAQHSQPESTNQQQPRNVPPADRQQQQVGLYFHLFQITSRTLFYPSVGCTRNGILRPVNVLLSTQAATACWIFSVCIFPFTYHLRSWSGYWFAASVQSILKLSPNFRFCPFEVLPNAPLSSSNTRVTDVGQNMLNFLTTPKNNSLVPTKAISKLFNIEFLFSV